MDKNAIKKYAVWARRELIEKVSQKALQYGIEEGKELDPKAESINGVLLSDVERKQRQALIDKINESGYMQVMEEVAYTWFNRFIALRFMEVNGYLPSHVRVFSNEAGEFQPQIMSEALHLELDGLDKEIVFNLRNDNKDDELFKYLLITQCNALSSIFPRMFQKISDYTELLLPDYLLREGSVIERMVNQKEGIPENDWKDQVQIIGWLYQYYNSELKDEVFAALKKNVKITKENIPPATQLFTPDWIVRYMVENSLGRLWIEGHQNDSLKSEWSYYLDEAEQENEVQKQLDVFRSELAELKPEDIRCIDPCMGSGHILCYIFDVLIKIYEDFGYSTREAVDSIVENNLWGLDIDERAAQLAYFAVMMKARQYDRRFFTKGIQPHVYNVEESNGITVESMHDMGNDLSKEEYDEALKQTLSLVDEMKNAKEYGSIISVKPHNWELLRRFAVPRGNSEGQLKLDIYGEMAASKRLQDLINVGEALSQKYHTVITNPPYMGANGMASALNSYIKKNYPNSKNDMSTVFMEKTLSMCKESGFMAMINIPVWMFLTSYEKLREKLLKNATLINMVHPGRGIFGSDFGSTSFVFRRGYIKNYYGSYRRLFDAQVEVKSPEQRELQFLEKKGACVASQDNFMKIPGMPIAYWVSDAIYSAFSTSSSLYEFAPTKMGLTTGDNNLFLKLWFEVAVNKIGDKFQFYNKGGEFRRWYGNISYVIDWENDGYAVRNFKGSTIRNDEYYFKKCISWGLITSSISSFRSTGDYSCVFGDAGPGCFPTEEQYYYVLGFLNSKPTDLFLSIMNPTINLSSGVTALLPFRYDVDLCLKISELSKQNEVISQEDWDSFETSWGFKRHPLCRKTAYISDAYSEWKEECNTRFEKLRENEEAINSMFIEIYGLQKDLKASVEDKDVSINKADLQRDIKSFISYAVGCMFGRYSIDCPGIVYAGGTWNSGQYEEYLPDADGIIPICDDEYFEDDIVGYFVKFVETIYGEETLEENLRFIAEALGGKGSPREAIRNYFLNDFYKDHCAQYAVTTSGKRPIYWLFDSGKKNGFKCLIYMHRYQPDTIARIRTDYVHEQQARYRTAIEEISNRIDNVSGSDKVKLTKRLNTLKAQNDEIHAYEEKIHHLADQMISIDLDDGVKVNYAKFKDVLAKIK